MTGWRSEPTAPLRLQRQPLTGTRRLPRVGRYRDTRRGDGHDRDHGGRRGTCSACGGRASAMIGWRLRCAILPASGARRGGCAASDGDAASTATATAKAWTEPSPHVDAPVVLTRRAGADTLSWASRSMSAQEPWTSAATHLGDTINSAVATAGPRRQRCCAAWGRRVRDDRRARGSSCLGPTSGVRAEQWSQHRGVRTL